MNARELPNKARPQPQASGSEHQREEESESGEVRPGVLEIQTDDLSKLSSILQLRAGKSKFKELIALLVEHASQAFQVLDFCTGFRNVHSGEIILQDIHGDKVFFEKLLEGSEVKIAQLCNEFQAQGSGVSRWIGLETSGEGDDAATIVTVLCGTSRYYVLLVASARDKQAITMRHREQLQLFSMLASGILQDALTIRELQHNNWLLKESADQLAGAETLAALTDMTSGMAHEFNNIIGGVIGRVQLMKLRVSDEGLSKDLSKIEKLLVEGAQTVRSLQEFATCTKYRKPEVIDLAQLLSGYFERTDHLWNKPAAEKAVRVVPTIRVSDARVDGSPADLKAVLDKLVENAIDYANENTTVDILLDEVKKGYRITVANKGLVIDDEIARKIFYPFFTTKQTRGAGLGLAIVHGIVGRHNGTIQVHTVGESETHFEIELPKADPEREDSDITRKRKKVGMLRILVVDDDEQIRDVLADMLSINGHTVTTCADAFAALDKMKDAEFDIVITDLGMAGMSGLDLAGLIHKDKPHIPVALITGWGSQLNHDEVALKGVKAVLPKPFHLEDINALVEKLAAGSQPKK